MASIDQPLKKRKLYDPFPDPPPLPANQSFVAPQSLPLSQDEILRRRRNREEIRSLYDCYRRIKFCVSQKDARLMPEFEQAYLSLITASRGCTSVQRIVAELIPRYASFCPTALEAAAKVSINMYNWSVSIVKRGEDVDGVAYQTAKACIFGLVDICCTASHEAPTSSVISGICSAVFQNVLTFFTSTLEGRDIYQIGLNEIQKLQEPMDVFREIKQEPEDESEAPLYKLFMFRARSLLRIFFSFPKDLIGACFQLLITSGTDVVHHQGTQYFLNQLTSLLNADEVNRSLDMISDGVPMHTDSAQCDTELKESEEVNPALKDSKSPEKKSLSTNSLIGMAVDRETSLRTWMVQRYKKLCESFSSEDVSEISYFLEKILGPLSDLVKDSGPDESNEDQCKTPKSISPLPVIYKIPTQQNNDADASGMEHSLRVHDASVDDTHHMDEDVAETDARQIVRSHNSLLSSSFGAHLGSEGERSVSTKNLEIGSLGESFPDKFSPKERTIPPVARRHLDYKADDPSIGNWASGIDRIQSSTTDLGPSRLPASVSSCNIFPSPRHHSSKHLASYNQVFWYSDGDPAAMDVFPASNELWLGSLGHDASARLVRMHFEDFGPVEKFIFLHAKDFALIEYRNIMDAVRAREYMQGSSPWGSSIRIKFIDRGLGSRGADNNVAVGDSCHVYIGKVSTQREKDKIMHELMMAGVRRPHMITDLSSENALLLEFWNAVEAAVAMRHIRHHRREIGRHVYSDRSLTLSTSLNDKFGSSCQLLVSQLDASVSDEEVINIFSRFGELNRWQFNRAEGCCFIDFRSHEAADLAKSQLHGARFGRTSILVEFTTESGISSNNMVTSPPASSVHENSIGSSATAKMNMSSYFPSHGDVYSSGVDVKPSNHYSSSFMYKPEGSVHELVSPRVKIDNLPTQVHSEHEFPKNWSTTNSREMQDIGSRKVDDFGRSIPLDQAFAGPAAQHAAEQAWQYNHQEVEQQNFAQGSLPYPPPGAHGGSMIPPPIQGSSYVRPYFNPSNAWDNSAHNSSMSNQIPAGMMPIDNCRIATRPILPFIPSSVTPVSQLAGGSFQRFEQMATVPTLSTVVPPPPLDAPPPLPSPPPLPLSQPPVVPPPPSSPPPQPAPEPSSMQVGEDCMYYQQWRGTLTKSGVHYCTIYAVREDSASCRYSNAVSEPVEWPDRLDVTKRTDIRHVKTTFASTRLSRREVCRLLPSTTNDHKGFHDFIAYLKQRDCAGVIKIPAGKSIWARLLFILPHSPETCSLFGISPQPSDCLIALVLPKDTGTEAS